MPCPRRYSQIACVIARIWFSLKLPEREDPRCPLVPNLTSWLGSDRVRLAIEVLAFQAREVYQQLLRRGAPGEW